MKAPILVVLTVFLSIVLVLLYRAVTIVTVWF